MFRLKPSDIRFSQDSINNYFDSKCNHCHKTIGETLDDICTDRCSVDDVPTIRVVLQDGHWTTADNRRLWVFRELERLGKCDEILVHKVHYIPEAKMTSLNEGISVRVRGSPGGLWHRKPTRKAIKANPATQRPSIRPSPIAPRAPSYTAPQTIGMGHHSTTTTGHVAPTYNAIYTSKDPYEYNRRLAQRNSQVSSARTPSTTRDHVVYPESRSSIRPSHSREQPVNSSSSLSERYYDDARPRSAREVRPSIYHDSVRDTGCCVIL